MPLTDTFLRNLKATDKIQKHSDGGGLYLHVSPTGGKLWRMAYRYDGKQKTLSFGAYPSVPLKDARTKREEAKVVKHPSIRQALEDARSLTCFLQRVAGDVNESDNSLSTTYAENEVWGQHLCFMLLRDKISIALGDLKFPFESIDEKNAPPLWRGPDQTK